jgi:hypothetical protein
MSKNLSVRRDLLRDHVLPKLSDPVRRSPELKARLADVINAVRSQGLEGVVAKRLDSGYEPGQRSGAWRKMRINQGQEFVIGGYTHGGKHFDDLFSVTTRTASYSTPREHAMASRQLRGRNYRRDSADSRSTNAHSSICQRRAVDDGGRA